MKKILVAICLVLGIINLTNTYIKANEYYYEETIEVIETSNARATSTKTGKKTGSYKTSSGKVLWSVSVTGTFTYNGSTSSCTKASVSTINNSENWKLSDVTSSKSGNTAVASVKAKCYLNGDLISSTSKTVKLTCDKNGNLS